MSCRSHGIIHTHARSSNAVDMGGRSKISHRSATWPNPLGSTNTRDGRRRSNFVSTTCIATPFAQQMHPPATSEIIDPCALPLDDAIAPSMPTSPISFTSTAQFPSLHSSNNLRIAVDLPAPNGPVMMLHGTTLNVDMLLPRDTLPRLTRCSTRVSPRRHVNCTLVEVPVEASARSCHLHSKLRTFVKSA